MPFPEVGRPRVVLLHPRGVTESDDDGAVVPTTFEEPVDPR